MSFLVLQQHELFYPKALSAFARFSLEFYLNYKVYLALEFKDFSAPTAIFQDFEGPWIFISKFKDFQGVCEPCVWYYGIGYPQGLPPYTRK